MYASFEKSLNEKRDLLNAPTTETVRSFLFLRKAIGMIGLALPIVLILGKIILEGPGVQPSISAYYYTVMRGVFVGSLCSIGVFLLSYRGHYKAGDIAGNVACVFAIGTALFPTTPAAEPTLVITTTQWIIGYVHLSFAAALFLTLAFFCLYVFQKPDPGNIKVAAGARYTYTFCGCAILLCIATIFLSSVFLSATFVQNHDIVFWFESFAIFFFGLSWVTKGRALNELLLQVEKLPQSAPLLSDNDSYAS